VVGDLAAVLAVQVEEVHVVDDHELGVATEEAVGGAGGQLGGVAALGAGMGVEPAEHRVQGPHRRGPGEGEVADRDPLVAAAAPLPVQFELFAMKLASEGDRDGRFPQARVGVDRGGTLDLVAVLPVAVDDLPQVLVDLFELRRLDRSEVGVPNGAQLVVPQSFRVGHGRELLDRLRCRPFADRRVDHLEPALLDRQAVGAFL
jgi:hypothetical protein